MWRRVAAKAFHSREFCEKCGSGGQYTLHVPVWFVREG